MKEAMKPRPAFVYDDELPDSLAEATPIPFGNPPGTKGHDQYQAIIVKLQARNTFVEDLDYPAPNLDVGLANEEKSRDQTRRLEMDQTTLVEP